MWNTVGMILMQTIIRENTILAGGARLIGHTLNVCLNFWQNKCLNTNKSRALLWYDIYVLNKLAN